MGTYVCTLAKHNLDTSSIETLAGDLAQRLDATIIYGYIDDWWDGRKATHDFIAMGAAGVNDAKIYILEWQRYYEYVMSMKIPWEYECAAVAVPENERHWEVRMTYGMPDGEDLDMRFYRDCFEPGKFYNGKWGRFLSPFMNDDETGWWEADVTEYRKNARHFQHLFGGGPGAWFIDSISMITPVVNISEWYITKPGYLKEWPALFWDDFEDLEPDVK